MRKTAVVVVLVAILLCGTTALQAQGSNMGIGLVIFDRGIFNIVGQLASGLDNMDISGFMPPSNIYVPIAMGNLRLEPEFGFFRSSNSEKDEFGKESSSTTAMRIGSGLFLVSPVSDKVAIYYGGRIGIVRYSENSEYDPKTGKTIESKGSSTNLFLGPCIGGEYFITERFSFGGEAQFFYTKLGEFKMDGADNDDAPEVSSSFMDTRYQFTCRWYFNKGK